jgi:hypothetical protein
MKLCGGPSCWQDTPFVPRLSPVRWISLGHFTSLRDLPSQFVGEPTPVRGFLLFTVATGTRLRDPEAWCALSAALPACRRFSPPSLSSPATLIIKYKMKAAPKPPSPPPATAKKSRGKGEPLSPPRLRFPSERLDALRALLAEVLTQTYSLLTSSTVTFKPLLAVAGS